MCVWASFVKNGEPLALNDNEAFGGVTWDRFARDDYLEICLNSAMRTGLYDDRMNGNEKTLEII